MTAPPHCAWINISCFLLTLTITFFSIVGIKYFFFKITQGGSEKKSLGNQDME